MKGIIITVIALLLIGGITAYTLFRIDLSVLRESLDLLQSGNTDAGLKKCIEESFFSRTKDICYLTFIGKNLDNIKKRGGDIQEGKSMVAKMCLKVTTEKAKRSCWKMTMLEND